MMSYADWYVSLWNKTERETRISVNGKSNRSLPINSLITHSTLLGAQWDCNVKPLDRIVHQWFLCDNIMCVRTRCLNLQLSQMLHDKFKQFMANRIKYKSSTQYNNKVADEEFILYQMFTCQKDAEAINVKCRAKIYKITIPIHTEIWSNVFAKTLHDKPRID
jgi:hypothetical protein